MPTFDYYIYQKGDGNFIALQMQAVPAATMFFTLSGSGVPRRPHKFKTRKQVFVNAAGQDLKLPYPTNTPPYALGSTITYNGSTWTAVELLAEVGTGDSP